jgi:serine/threonine-protein kinase SRPK3
LSVFIYQFLPGQLKNTPTIFNWSIKARLEEPKALSDEEATATVSLIEGRLHLNPTHRFTAAELLSDRWFNDVK